MSENTAIKKIKQELFYQFRQTGCEIQVTSTKPKHRNMRALSELFEFLSHCDYLTMRDEIREHGIRIIRSNSRFQAETTLKFDLERLNTLLRFSESYYLTELPRILKELETQSNPEELLTVEETARFLKTTTQTVYTLLKKEKLKRVEISTVDKPGARPIVRIRKSDIDRYLDGK